MKKITYEEVEVTVDINHEDVMDYISDYATDSELDEIRDLIIVQEKIEIKPITLFDEMKKILLVKAAKKISLEELEAKLGITHLD